MSAEAVAGSALSIIVFSPSLPLTETSLAEETYTDTEREREREGGGWIAEKLHPSSGATPPFSIYIRPIGDQTARLGAATSRLNHSTATNNNNNKDENPKRKKVEKKKKY